MKPQQIGEEYTISRRQALVAIAALPTALLIAVYQRQESTLVIREFLSRCAASIAACRHLINGRELGAVEQVLPQYVSTLKTLAQQPSPHQPVAARLVVQADDLQGILALHRNNLIAMEYYYREGVTYSRLAGDRNLYVYALRKVLAALHQQCALRVGVGDLSGDIAISSRGSFPVTWHRLCLAGLGLWT
jgi:hypothetical protein